MTVRPTSRALNKPLLLLGIDPKIVSLSLVIAVIIAANSDAMLARFIAGAVFLMLCAGGRRLARFDARATSVLQLAWAQKPIYDPLKRVS
jgi:type IV secretory pathway TrbD component